MRFDIVTVFPQMLREFSTYGVIGRAVENRLIEVGTTDPREYTEDKHGAVDDTLYGGGSGMLMMAPCLCAALCAAKEKQPPNNLTIYLSPQGRPLDQKQVNRFAREYDGIVMLAGRYKGIDERVLAMTDEEWSVGDYVLSGGEPAAMVVLDAVARQIKGVVGDRESVQSDSFMDGLLDAPHYTRPREYMGMSVPQVLLEGNHREIKRWRLKQSLGRTFVRRPDLLHQRELTAEERELLDEYLAGHGLLPEEHDEET